MWLDTQDARSRDRNPSNFTLDCVSTKRTTLAKGILRYFYFQKQQQQQQPLFTSVYTLSATSAPNSFEELCITQAEAGNSFARELNPHGGAYIYILRETERQRERDREIIRYLYISHNMILKSPIKNKILYFSFHPALLACFWTFSTFIINFDLREHCEICKIFKDRLFKHFHLVCCSGQTISKQ